MNRKLLTAVMFCALLTSCNSSERQAQEVIRNQMKDPDSARFGRFETNGKKACLEVNGKNSFGGYTGFQTAFLEKGAKGKWDGYIVPPPADFDFCLREMNGTK